MPLNWRIARSALCVKSEKKNHFLTGTMCTKSVAVREYHQHALPYWVQPFLMIFGMKTLISLKI